MPLPNFLVIGAQKTGTKWLHGNMAKHPGIFVPWAGGGLEVHYFDSRRLGQVPWYLRHYRGSGTTPLRGDITPGYSCMSESRIREVYKLVPRAKIIFTLRNPKERAISAVRMELRGLTYGGKPRKTKIDSNDVEAIIKFCCRGMGFRYGDYGTHLKRWCKVFPQEQILLLSYDQLLADPQGYLFSIYSFLGADLIWNPKVAERRVHASEPYPLPSELYSLLDETYNPLISRLAPIVPFDVKGWLAPVSR